MMRQGSFYVTTEYSYVATKFGLNMGFQVAIEYFLVVIEFWGKGQESLRRDKEFNVATDLLEIVSQ